MKHQIVRYDSGFDGELLGYAEQIYNKTAITDHSPVLGLKELADFCDGNAESRNNHEFVGTHRLLAAFLNRHVGTVKATALMMDIAMRGGLDGMSGLYWFNSGGQDTSAFADFGIVDCWKNYELPAIEAHP